MCSSHILFSKPLQMKVTGVQFLTGGSSKPSKAGVIAGGAIGGALLVLGILIYTRARRHIRIALSDTLEDRLEGAVEPYIIPSDSPGSADNVISQQDRKGVPASRPNLEAAIETQSEVIRREVARYLAPPSYNIEAHM